MTIMDTVKISDITIPENRMRPVGNLDALIESMGTIGQLCPVVLSESLTLIAGLHRIEAAKSLGWTQVKASIVTVSDIDAQIAEIDENLIRNELTTLERSVHIARRKELYIAKFPETKHGGAGRRGSGNGQTVSENEIVSFSEDTAKKTGVSRRTIEHDVKIGTMPDAVIDALRGSAIEDRKTDLVALSRLPEPEQMIVVERLKSAATVEELHSEILKLSSEIRSKKTEKRRKDRNQRNIEISKNNRDLGKETYSVILADPPWEYNHTETESRAIENQYPTMSLDDICKLPVKSICNPDAVLFMWVTSPKLEEGLRVLREWGFTYKTCAVWTKDKIGMGYWFRQQHELLLVGTIGNIPPPTPSNRVSSLFAGKRTNHSAKPASAYEAIESMFPGMSRIELFCRTPREGWGAWGNQS
jgi:N6-adenosine-specific RNA methylase IME4